MDYYSLLEKRTKTKRIVTGILLVIIAAAFFLGGIRQVCDSFNTETVHIIDSDLDNRSLEKFAGKNVIIDVTQVDMFLGGKERYGTKNQIIPCKKSGWMIQYEGCLQNVFLIAGSDDSDKLREQYEKTYHYENGELDEYPVFNMEVKGKVVKRSGIWKKYIEQYRDYLVEEEEIENVEKFDMVFSEYMIDTTDGFPLYHEGLVIISVIMLIIAIVILSGLYIRPDKRRIDRLIADSKRTINPTKLSKDYKAAYKTGNASCGNIFFYYVKGFQTRIIKLDDIEDAELKNRMFARKLIVQCKDGRKVKVRIKKGEDRILDLLRKGLECNEKQEQD